MSAKIRDLIGSRIFLFTSCLAIFCLSILLRSITDIGPDTGIYLDLGKKVALGKRYYYDFFESNFPLSFYFYAIQHKLSEILKISPIILSEIVINTLALLSIFWSAKILSRSEIAENKAHFNLVIIAFFLGFFLRPHGLPLAEFGTKTSLILMLLYPYLSYSFSSKNNSSKKSLIARGLLMGLMPCLKPHYIIFPLIVEIYRSWQKKSLSSIFELDKLIASATYLLYLLWMMLSMPEFFEMIVPMWLKIYGSYESENIFFGNLCRLIAAHIGIFSFTFLIFSRLKPDQNDRILITFFIAAVVLFISENAMTIDQSVIFYAIATICVFKFAFDFFGSDKFLLSENKFILASLFIIPAFDPGIMPSAIFGLSGFANVWWILAPFLFRRNPRFLLGYFAALALGIAVIREFGNWTYLAFNLLSLLIFSFFYERKISRKYSEKFSSFAVFLFCASIASLLHIYINDIVTVFNRDHKYTYPNRVSDMINYYAKEFAPNQSDQLITLSSGNGFSFPRINYLKKDNHHKFHTISLQAGPSNKLMFDLADKEGLLVNYYLFEDVKAAIKNPQTKVILINNTPEIFDKNSRCIIGALEYYFLDPDFRKFFIENFRFENRVIIDHEVRVMENIPIVTGVESSIFDQVEKSKKQITHDFEIYIRK